MSDWYRIVKRTGRIDDIAARLDAMTHEERVREVRRMCGKTQAMLWQMADGRAIGLDHFVPADVPPLTEVIHFGKNSLPVLSAFEKRFCRPSDDGEQGVLYGYNEGMTRPVVGPGYFVVRESKGNSKGDVVLDYYSTPSEKVPAWPAIAVKDAGIPAVVYGFMNDYMRKVSDHVSIGRAFKHHCVTNNYFLLVRDGR
jgi:hypothetical protein